MIQITISYDGTVNRENLDRTPHSSGIYVFFDKENKPLYVGQASDLNSRINLHFSGKSNTSFYSHLFFECRFFEEDNQLNKDIYEMYLINTLYTQINLAKNYTKVNEKPTKLPKRKMSEKIMCNYIKPNNERCRLHAHSNGFCHYHGGDGITREKIMKAALENF